jgi:hypothetical protein
MKTYTIEKFTFQPIRFVMTILASVLFLLTTTVPAFAFGFGSAPSQPTDGTVQLEKIEQRAEDIAGAKVAPGSMEEAEKRAKGGINEVQGAADKDQMSRPSNSKGATTVKDQIGKALKKASD